MWGLQTITFLLSIKMLQWISCQKQVKNSQNEMQNKIFKSQLCNQQIVSALGNIEHSST